ncbi:LysR substrate-binding domain-containing protein [Kushneria aurantia]|uniref:LysR substrate-binding domain-containing protein n=1 Tax=Kushneria aurantia TaxID=504092 RepID=A0ABV6G1W4_9GAMM|nr:LysR substrate-binding domain-containing protein [Kushneria aurantia]
MRMSPLPPLNTLIAFEAAVRHMSFTRAATELNLSQSAVSRQITDLEQFLGRTLFIRQQRQLLLTRAGEIYAHQVRDMLETCTHATAEVMKSVGENELTVACTPGVAQFWMTPQLSRFRREHPDIQLRLIVRKDFASLSSFEFDLGVYYLPGSTLHGFDTTLLIPEEVHPVCSPGYLAACRRRLGLDSSELLGPAQLNAETLLVLEDSRSIWLSWPQWFACNGLLEPRLHHNTMTSNHYPSLIEMAALGDGIALGWRHIIDSQIATGRLVRASHHSASHGQGYYLITPAERHRNHATRLLHRWLLAKAPDRA